MTSITRTLTLSLSVAAIAIFLALLAIVVWLAINREPSSQLCEAATEILTRAAMVDAGGHLAVRPTDDLKEFEADSPSLWYTVSHAGRIVEFAPERRPGLPFALDHTGPIGRSLVDTLDQNSSFCVEIEQREASKLVVMVGGASLSFAQFAKSFILRNRSPVLALAVAFAAIVAAGAILSASFVARSIERVTKLALAIEPSAPQASIPLDQIPSELVALVNALNRAFEEIAAYMNRQRRFMYAAHELRTPLTLLRAKIEDVPDAALKTELVRDIRRLTSLVSAMLDLARLQNQAIDKRPIDLSAMTREVLADFGPSALDAGIELSLEQDRQGPIMVKAVEAAVRSALANLVGNALTHARGATRIVADLKQGSVAISDNGIGFPPGQGSNLVEPFQKGESSSQGAGLGLSIVREIMVAHSGSVSVASTPGHGTVACLRFAEAAPASSP